MEFTIMLAEEVENGTLYLLPQHIVCMDCHAHINRDLLFGNGLDVVTCKNGHKHDKKEYAKFFGVIKNVKV